MISLAVSSAIYTVLFIILLIVLGKKKKEIELEKEKELSAIRNKKEFLRDRSRTLTGSKINEGRGDLMNILSNESPRNDDSSSSKDIEENLGKVIN